MGGDLPHECHFENVSVGYDPRGGPRTLDRHLDNIYRKLGVSSLVAAIIASASSVGPSSLPQSLEAGDDVQ